MKTHSDILTTRYGGVIPVIKEMIKRGMPELIDSSLEKDVPRKHNSKYKFSDMFLSWIAAALCGATRIDHVTGLKDDLGVIPGLNVPSHDTMGRMMKLLSSNTKIQERKMNHQVNANYYDDNISLNKLLIQASKRMGILNEDKEYILDVDCTFIDTRCIGAKSMKDKDAPGFYPMICLIGELPVFVEMRNGNSIADFRIAECIEGCLKILESENIKIKKVRTDGAGYRKDLIEMFDVRNVKFISGSPVNKSHKTMHKQFETAEWKKVVFETANSIKDCQIGEIAYIMHEQETPIRIIALRVPTRPKLIKDLPYEDVLHLRNNERRLEKLKREDKLKAPNKRYVSTKWNTIKDFKYKMIATNDFETSGEELLYLYNQRGDSERKFSFMKNDFGWKYPPFMNMNENTVFFILSALANNVFRAIAELYKEEISDLKLNARVRKFQKAFIDAIAIYNDGEWVFYNTKIDFGKIA